MAKLVYVENYDTEVPDVKMNFVFPTTIIKQHLTGAKRNTLKPGWKIFGIKHLPKPLCVTGTNGSNRGT